MSGKFSTVNGTLLSDREYVVSYTPTSVVATVEPLPPPTVTAVSPSAGPPAGANKVTLTGTYFVAGATV